MKLMNTIKRNLFMSKEVRTRREVHDLWPGHPGHQEWRLVREYIWVRNDRKIAFFIAGVIMLFTTPVVVSVAYNVLSADGDTVVEQTTETAINNEPVEPGYTGYCEGNVWVWDNVVQNWMCENDIDPTATTTTLPPVYQVQYVCDMAPSTSSNYLFRQFTGSSGTVISDGSAEDTRYIFSMIQEKDIYLYVDIMGIDEDHELWREFADAADYLSIYLNKNITVGTDEIGEDFTGIVLPIRSEFDPRQHGTNNDGEGVAWNETRVSGFLGFYFADNAVYIRENFLFGTGEWSNDPYAFKHTGFTTLIHEFAHSMGFDHVSGYDAVMSYESDESVRHYLPGDDAGFQALICNK